MVLLALAAAFLAVLAGGAGPAQAATTCTKVVDDFGNHFNNQGADFLVRDLVVPYGGGPVKLARSCAGDDAISVDVGLRVEVGGPGNAFSHDFSGGCSGAITPAGPFDITSLFQPGNNQVKVRFRDLCGQGGSGASDVYLIAEEATRHYRVELKAWIPKAAVVDPNNPWPVPVGALLTPPLRFIAYDPAARRPCQLGPPVTLTSIVRSSFRGDAHAEYDGSFRVRPVAEFDWNGTEIENFTVTQGTDNFGITSLDYEYRVDGGQVIRCSRDKQQVSAAGGRQLSPTEFELSMSADDPLVYPRLAAPLDVDSLLVPNIDSTLTGHFETDGTLALDYLTDLFPNHGVRVTVDGTDVETRVTNDVSCLDDSSVRGLFGMGLLATALSIPDNAGVFTVDPDQAPQSSSTPGFACSVSFLTLDFVSFARNQLLNQARGASAASTLRLAPLGADGKPGTFVTLEQAVASSLLTSYQGPAGHLSIGVRPDRPVVLRSRGSLALTVTRLVNGGPARPARFGPVTGRIKAILTGDSVTVTRNGKRLRPGRPDTRPPRTRAKVRIRGRRAIVTLKARDASGIQSTVVTLKRKVLKLRRGRVRIAKGKLRHLRFSSVDVFGNAERPRRIRRR